MVSFITRRTGGDANGKQYRNGNRPDRRALDWRSITDLDGHRLGREIRAAGRTSSSWSVKFERPSSVLTGLAMSRTYRVLVADNHAVVRRGIRALLECQRDVEVCGEVSS